METILKPTAIKFDYFNLYDFIEKIKLHDYVIEHANYSKESLDIYMNKLTKLNCKAIDYFLIHCFYEEIKDSNLIEHHLIYPEEVLNGDYYMDNLNISHKRIKDLHDFAERSTGEYEYRSIDAWVRLLKNDIQTIYWYGAKPEDIQKFMNDFIKIYKDKSIFGDNILLKCTLIHMLFLRIHPFKDGNGRTTRLISDMKFTELSNRMYGTKLSIAPLHLSHSLYVNRSEYYKRMDVLYFGLEHDGNDEINRLFDFMLNMCDEQLYYMENKLDHSSTALYNAVMLEESGIEKDEVIKRLKLENTSN